jgi:hypothetical protein
MTRPERYNREAMALDTHEVKRINNDRCREESADVVAKTSL